MTFARRLITAIAACLAFGIPAANAAPVLWIDDAYGKLGKVDVATGDVTLVGDMGVVMTDIAFDPAGNLYGISLTALYQINKDTAVPTMIGNTGIFMNSLVFDAEGTLFTANNQLYKLSTATGTATLIGNGGASHSSAGDLAFIGGELFLSSLSSPTDFAGQNKLIKLDKTTGIGTLVGDIGAPVVYGMATDNNVDLYGVSGWTILSINPSSGAGTAIKNYDLFGALYAANGTAFISEAAPAVPVPAAVWLLGSGMLWLVGFARRSHKV